MSHNRPHHHPHHQGNIPPTQTRPALYTYPMMQHPGIPAQHIPGVYPQCANRMPLQPQLYYYNQQPQLSEEQMKMQLREHNYHIQQQRLRSFNASSSNQKRVNPDDLIQSMFGKTQNVKRSTQVVPKAVPKPQVTQKPTPRPENAPQAAEVAPQPSINKKNLEDMLLECSDLMRPGKAHSFPKETNKRKNSKEIKSDETGEMKTNNLGFPCWCFVEAQIPDLYRRVQRAATTENAIDTNLLYPILVSSGLNRDVLGHVWALVNQTTPGKLLPHELYSALTLIALAQNGYKFTGLDILQSLARPLVPFLKDFMAPQPAQTDARDILDDSQEEFTEFLGFAPTVQPPLIGSSAVGNRLANYNVGMSPPAKEKDRNVEEISKMNESAYFNAADGPNLMSKDDKYGIFRELDEKRHSIDSTDKIEDEFGDFLSGAENKLAESSIAHVKGFKSVDSFMQTSLTQFQMTKNVPDDDLEFGDFVSPNLGAKDSGSAESRSVSSLDLGPVDAVVAGNDNASLRSFELKSTFHDDEFADLHKDSINRVSDDRYRFIRSHMQSDLERNTQEWERCLDSCYQLLDGADSILNDISSESVADEVIKSDGGINYLKSIVEIYLISARLQHSMKMSGLASESLTKLLGNINTSWTNILSFISKSNLTPSQDHFHFTDEIPKANGQLCGVCLLNVDIQSLEFSGRQYHTTCANFWVNCVNSLLPALAPQQQLLY